MFVSFPSIEQYRHIIKAVKHRTNYNGKDEDGKPVFVARTQPKLKFRGTVKMHGTNAAIVLNADDTITFQSRERVLSLQEDNAEFMLHMSAHMDEIRQMFGDIAEAVDAHGSDESIAVFGEWAGGNIQKGVALNEVKKFFAIFAVRVVNGVGETRWADLNLIRHCEFPQARIFHVFSFGTWHVEIDFERPEESQNLLAAYTTDVENECPAGRYFGVSGTGEGIVWHCCEPGWESSDFWFKVKGEKHSVTKVKKLASVDVEFIRAVNDFVDATVTEPRLMQGLLHVVRELGKPFEVTSLGDFIRWVYNDIMKEEADTIVANQIDPKRLGAPVADRSRKWFMTALNDRPNLIDEV